MARNQRKYDQKYKVQAVKLTKEIGVTKAAKELGIPGGTIHAWLSAARIGKLDIDAGSTYTRISDESCGGTCDAS